MSFIFKESCPDSRSIRVNDLMKAFQEFGRLVDVPGCSANSTEAGKKYGEILISEREHSAYEGVLFAVMRGRAMALKTKLRSLFRF